MYKHKFLVNFYFYLYDIYLYNEVNFSYKLAKFRQMWYNGFILYDFIVVNSWEMIKIRIIFSIIFSLSLMINTAFADNIFPFNGAGFIKAGDRDNSIFWGKGISTDTLVPAVDDALGGGLVSILVALYQIGDVIAVIVLCFMGVKLFVTSPQQKAQLKASLTPYFIGLLLYMVGVPIAVLIINILISFF